MNTMRVRFWVESALASLTAVLAIVTVFWHEWIEILFKVDPDGGDGSLEWLIVLGLAVTTIILASLARMDWRRARAVS
jgi:undecaprenyl pyrophosphate phosphatase UppP